MNREFLKKNGKLLGEVDFTQIHNDIYAGTKYYYWYNNSLYISTYHSNLNSYTGESGTEFCGTKESLTKELQSQYYIDIPAFVGVCSEDIIKSVCEICGVEYDENNYFG